MWPLQTDSFAPHNALEIHSVVCSSLFLSNIPQHGHSTVSLTHHLLEDTLVVYSLGLLQMKSLWNKVLVLSFFFFLVILLDVWWYLILYFPHAQWYWTSFHVLAHHLCSSLVNFPVITHFLLCFFLFLMLRLRVFYIPDTFYQFEWIWKVYFPLYLLTLPIHNIIVLNISSTSTENHIRQGQTFCFYHQT